MRHRNARQRGAQGTPESAGRVALDDDERRSFDGESDPARDLSDVGMRVVLANAPDLDQWKATHAESCRIELRMLARKDDPRDDPVDGERFCYR
jgi:hypothetical protein